MSLLALPSEIFQQVLSETVTDSYENFINLRLVHSQFDNAIRESAEYLMKKLIHAQNASDHALSLHRHLDESIAGTNPARQNLSSLLRLYKNVATCVQLEGVLHTHREKFAAFPIWADVPAKGFGSVESVLVFSAFHRELVRTANAQEDTNLSAMLARADFDNTSFEWLKLDQHFMDFVRVQMTVDDLQSLMIIVNFCAVSTRFIDTILTSRYYFNDAGASDHWQNEQLGSALLSERILWGGPSWLAKMIHENIEQKGLTTLTQQRSTLATQDEHTVWNGSRADAARLTANGVARFLWKERARRLELERVDAERSGVKFKVRPSLRIDPAVWRGSAGV